MKLPLCSCEAINDSTSPRNSSSPEHARETNELRSSGRYVIAELKISFTCCQRSGVIQYLWLNQVSKFRRAGIIEIPSLQLPSQPGTGHFPVALDGRMPDSEHFSDFFNRKPGKEFQFDNPALLRVDMCELIERFVQGK